MNSYKGKKLLILAGNHVHGKLVQAARAMGVYTIVTDYLPPEESPAKLMADEYWMLSTGDIDAVVEKCRQEKVDGVLSYAIDTVQFHYQAICEKLGVPCYGTHRQCEIMTNKRLFKDFCQAHGVGVIPEYTLEDVKAGKACYPVLVKPVDGRGSRGQSICHTAEEVIAAVEYARTESRDGGFLIERYMTAEHDMAFAYIVVGGEPYLIKIGDRYLGKAEDGLEKQQMATLLPSRFAEQYIRTADPKVKAMIKALGLSFGPVFIQGFFDGGHIYMYDPGLRFPGTDFDIVLKEATGFDTMTTFVQFALSGDVNSAAGKLDGNVYAYGGKTCLILSVSVRPGTIASITGMDEIARHEGVLSASYWHHPGDTVPATGDIRQRVVEFCCLLPDRASAKDFVSYVYSTLRILDADGRDMIVSRVTF